MSETRVKGAEEEESEEELVEEETVEEESAEEETVEEETAEESDEEEVEGPEDVKGSDEESAGPEDVKEGAEASEDDMEIPFPDELGVCECLNGHDQAVYFPADEPAYIIYSVDGEDFRYPPYYGAAGCQAYDSGLDPECAENSEHYCTAQWCYVSPDCAASDTTVANLNSEISYSYATCGFSAEEVVEEEMVEEAVVEEETETTEEEVITEESTEEEATEEESTEEESTEEEVIEEPDLRSLH